MADAVDRTTGLTGLAITAELAARASDACGPSRRSSCGWCRKPFRMCASTAGHRSVIVASVIDGEEWVLTVRDDGRGFDVGAVAARGRRNFGLQFMQERAELIGAHFEVQSQPDSGTTVRLAIPMGT